MRTILPQKKVVSFDVFDTVVIRNTYRPEDVFARVYKRITGTDIVSTSLPDFAAQRVAAEKKARLALMGKEEVSHNEIMATMAQQLGLNDEAASSISAYEIKEEVEAAYPIEPTLSLLKKLRSDGTQIVFISDMYLDYDVIKKMLIKIGAFDNDDKLYVSSLSGCKKSTGLLYKHVVEDLKIPKKQILHIGDYLLSDYLVPKFSQRIESIIFRTARNNIYENLLGEPCSCLYCSSIAGASRAARVALAGEVTPLEKAFYNLGCNVLGPILIGFMLWVLERASKMGIQRLYFLSRDGEVMLDVAKFLADCLGIKIELRYLYVSRSSTFSALLKEELTPRNIEWLKEDNVVLTVKILADRLGFDPASLYVLLLHAGIQPKSPDAPLGKNTVEDICDVLLTDPVLKGMLRKLGAERMSSLGGYLEQEGLFDGTRFALVDLGWHGSIQDVFLKCFQDRFEDSCITGFYFGIDRASTGDNRKFGYLFEYDGSYGSKYSHVFRVLMEILCTGQHGMVRTYGINSHGDVEPVCRPVEHDQNIKFIEFLRNGVSKFLRCIDASSLECCNYQHIRPQILSILLKIFFYPDRLEAEALGEISFSADQAGHNVHRMAPPLTLFSSLCYLIKSSYALRSTVSSWFFGSWVRSPFLIKLFLYPLVGIIRIYYVGVWMPKLGKQRLIDTLNRFINMRIGLVK
ncbi:hypothetical protein F6V30_12215 [Oryzomonas sagensis]|uniref:Uncharacterized protein n=1 Tax=Oryzomonas sagensis TaxID=2603857 RepID=A0ABQ6TMY7_9BACT|nr:hypothetical protein [Oryzomonas sagensis]KAB0669563.1 hypothetical protein F6V30_12215 [Oryzomonas sagensis]